ncbi:MAG TPA: response regulator [Candidatus Nanoarchaeia archaeon]|nr:response regulator [Candidatus Nanoarchaeia archaeon]
MEEAEKGKILVVDDSKAIRRFYCGIFQKNFPDYNVLEADNNKRALLLARRGDISLLITDHERGIEVEKGVDLVRELRDSGASYPILMVSGHVPLKLKQEGVLEQGVSGIIYKPDIFDDIFIKIIGEFLETGKSDTYEAYSRA